MHPQAYAWIAEQVVKFDLADAERVVDLGGRNAYVPAGSVHGLFSHRVEVVDAIAAPDVDYVCLAESWSPPHEYDVVLSTETFEHTPMWRDILDVAATATGSEGMLLITCARDARPPHSALDGGPLRAGEFYQNLTAADMYAHLASQAPWNDFEVYEGDGHFGNDDLYAWARRG